jgi:hypothetical protein
MTKKGEEEKDVYRDDDLIKYIRETLSDELNAKLANEDILALTAFEDDYIEALYQKNLSRKPFIAFELIHIDQENINAYVLKKATEHHLILAYEEVKTIMDAELEFLNSLGLTEEIIRPN